MHALTSILFGVLFPPVLFDCIHCIVHCCLFILYLFGLMSTRLSKYYYYIPPDMSLSPHIFPTQFALSLTGITTNTANAEQFRRTTALPVCYSKHSQMR